MDTKVVFELQTIRKNWLCKNNTEKVVNVLLPKKPLPLTIGVVTVKEVVNALIVEGVASALIAKGVGSAQIVVKTLGVDVATIGIDIMLKLLLLPLLIPTLVLLFIPILLL